MKKSRTGSYLNIIVDLYRVRKEVTTGIREESATFVTPQLLEKGLIINSDSVPICKASGLIYPPLRQIAILFLGYRNKFSGVMKICPEVILVKSHGNFNTPTDKVRGILEDLSYNVISEEIADIDQKENCLENDIRVLTGISEKT